MNKVRNTISTVYVSLTAVIFHFHGLILNRFFTLYGLMASLEDITMLVIFVSV